MRWTERKPYRGTYELGNIPVFQKKTGSSHCGGWKTIKGDLLSGVRCQADGVRASKPVEHIILTWAWSDRERGETDVKFVTASQCVCVCVCVCMFYRPFEDPGFVTSETKTPPRVCDFLMARFKVSVSFGMT